MASSPELYLITVAVASGGALAIVRGALAIPRAFASVRWRAAEGEVVAAELDPALGGGLAVSYRYTVDGHCFTGDRLYASGLPGPVGEVAMLEYYRHRPGQGVLVYYDPHEPRRSALQKVPVWRAVWSLIGGVFLVFLGVVLVYVWQTLW